MKLSRSTWRFARRRECLVPTWQGWVLLTCFCVALVVMLVLRVHPFLVVTERVQATVLVVEGWVPDYVLEEARTEFDRRHYRILYVTGGPLERGEPLSEYRTYAALGAATLLRMGMSKESIECVPAPLTRKDRTYTSAVALKNWLHRYGAKETSINVVSLGAHARRSRLLFQQAFGEEAQVGIVAVEDRNYDSRRWWKFSQGVRTVVGELVAFMYAVVIFRFV